MKVVRRALKSRDFGYPLSLAAAFSVILGFSNCSTWVGSMKPEEDPNQAAALESDPTPRPAFKHGARATRDDFVDQSQEAGSLWASSGQTNYFFTKNKIRSPGDIVSLVLEEELYRRVGTEIKNSLGNNEQTEEVSLLREETRKKLQMIGVSSPSVGTETAPPKPAKGNSDTLATTSASPTKPGAPADAKNTAKAAATPPSSAETATPGVQPLAPEEIEKAVEKIGMAEVDIFRALELKPGDKLMGEITRRYPNGNYQIRVSKGIPYKHGGPRNINVVAVVKATDIAEETDTIQSNTLYETQIDVIQ